MLNKTENISPRTTVSRAQISALALENARKTYGNSYAGAFGNSAGNTQKQPVSEPEVDKKQEFEDKRNACIANNLGVENTFVWASRYSKGSDYASLVEDVEKPENNICFVKVDLKSEDKRVDLSDVGSQYFMMGKNIVCGFWTEEDDIEKRILEGKKTARILGSVGAAVGGAGIDVGAMELFGNKLIGGKVEGQRSMSDIAFWALKLKEKGMDSKEYKDAKAKLKDLEEKCTDIEKVKTQTKDLEELETICRKFKGMLKLMQ
jgi:hypothetical protein